MIVPRHALSETAQEKGLDDFQKLSNQFVNPPMSSRPGAFWCWLNGDVTKASITNDLEEMKAKGMGRAEIWDVAAVYNPNGAYGVGPQFMGDESVEYIKHALSEGKRLGIKMGMVASSGWNAGGSWVTADWAAKALYSSEMKVAGPQSFSGSIPFPEVPKGCPKDKDGMPVFYKEIAVVAMPDNADKKRIEVWNNQCIDPTEVRYAWARNPLGNLVNSNCQIIPVPLYRSDNWEYPEAPYPPDEYNAYRSRMKSLRQQADELARLRILHEADTIVNDAKNNK